MNLSNGHSMSLANGNSHSNGNSFAGEGTEQECPFIRRILAVAEDRP